MPTDESRRKEALDALLRMRMAPPTPNETRRFDTLVRALEESRPKLDSVVASSVASSTHLSELAIPPVKSGTEYAIERVEHEVGRLASIAAEMAANTRANAEVARAGVDQSIALVTLLGALHETTRQGIGANDRSARSLVWLTRVLAALTIELVIVTLVLVMQAR